VGIEIGPSISAEGYNPFKGEGGGQDESNIQLTPRTGHECLLFEECHAPSIIYRTSLLRVVYCWPLLGSFF